MADIIRIDGLAAFSRNIKKLDAGLAPGLRLALNKVADVVVEEARPQVPKRTGKARASIKARSTRTLVRIQAGGTRARYYQWLDWGGRVGKNRSVKRPFIKEGRYLYPSYHKVKDSGELNKVLTKSLLDVAARAGIVVD